MNEKGLAEFALIMTLSLMLSLYYSLIEKLMLHTLFLRDYQHIQQTRTVAYNDAILKFMYTSNTLTQGTYCTLGTAEKNKFKLQRYFCAKKSNSTKSINSYHIFSEIFDRAFTCPIRNTQHSKSFPNFRFRSFRTCINPEKLVTPIVHGDLIFNEPIKLINQQSFDLIASTGSILFNSLTLSNNTAIVALGNIDILQIHNASPLPIELQIYAPLGKLSITSIDQSIKLSINVAFEYIPQSISRTPWHPIPGITQKSTLPLGFFEKAL